ncbi:MAG: hypothetical protein QOH79_3149 [Acidimicrobiaceae bacterium]
MGEKGNVADVRGAGGHVASAAQAARGPQDVGLGGQSLSGAAPAPPSGGGGGGLLDDLAGKAQDKATDIGLGGRGGAAGIVKGKDKDEDADDES